MTCCDLPSSNLQVYSARRLGFFYAAAAIAEGTVGQPEDRVQYKHTQAHTHSQHLFSGRAKTAGSSSSSSRLPVAAAAPHPGDAQAVDKYLGQRH